NFPGDRVIFTESSTAPGIPIVYRTVEERAYNPERLNLDSRGMTMCPILDGEEDLRLLSLQHNLIRRAQHLSHLRRLVFLDLYANELEEISGLYNLRSLRVLMLGKNRIRKITSLESLTKLDVLDLHGNQIVRIENLSHLSELRVLNLAGNQITHVDSLRGLHSLAELNLRRNNISSMKEVDCLPSLQRLFLSYNNIANFDGIVCLREAPSLCEVALDGNPLAQEACYRQTALRHMGQLRQLDMKRVTEEERRLASLLARKQEEKKREFHKQAIQKEKRRLALRNVARHWSLQNNTAAAARKYWYSYTVQPRKGCLEGEISSTFLDQFPPFESHGLADSLRLLSLTEEHLAEMEGDTLRLFGRGALEALDRSWGAHAAATITAVSFSYVDFDEVAGVLGKLRARFPGTAHLQFTETNLQNLQQLNALAQLRRIEQLTVNPAGNSLTALSLWTAYATFRLHHLGLRRINGQEISATDVTAAEAMFGSLARLTAPRASTSALGDGRKKEERRLRELSERKKGVLQTRGRIRSSALIIGLKKKKGESYFVTREYFNLAMKEQEEKGRFCQDYVKELVDRVVLQEKKQEALQIIWPQFFLEMVTDAVLETQDSDTYVSRRMKELTEEK
uniref:Leucine rich repeat containing 49 n=1 Tax=Petromyzon marinus TaxID=7757 RepID=S4R6A0_PETMA